MGVVKKNKLKVNATPSVTPGVGYVQPRPSPTIPAATTPQATLGSKIRGVATNLKMNAAVGGGSKSTDYGPGYSMTKQTTLAGPESGYIHSAGNLIKRAMDGAQKAYEAPDFSYSGPDWRNLTEPERGEFQYEGPKWTDYKAPELKDFEYEPFQTAEFNRTAFQAGPMTNEYLDKLKETESGKPEAFNSRYEGAIQNILDGILNGNKGPWDATKDANYNMLYNQAREQAMVNGQKAMRDTMGTMQGMTGGYGSTAAAAAAGQAYDNSLQQLNAQNPQLMQLAYDMYRSGVNDRYQQMNVLRGLDNTDYSRYRDTVGDWAADRDYYANAYANAYNRDWNEYQYNTNQDWNEYLQRENQRWNQHTYDTNMAWNNYTYGSDRDWAQYLNNQEKAMQAERYARADWENDRNDEYNRFLNNRNLYYQAERDARSDFNADRAFDYGMYRDTVGDQQWRDQFDYGKQRDAVADSQWQAQFDYGKQRDTVGDQRWQTEFDYSKSRDTLKDTDDALNAALKWASAGYQIPKEYADRIDPATLQQLQGIAALAVAGGGSGGSGGGGGGRRKGSGGGGSSSGDSDTYTIRTGAPYQSGVGYFDNEDRVADLARGASGPAMANDIINYAVNDGTIQPEFASELSDYINSDLANTNWNRPKTIKETVLPGYIEAPAAATKASSDYYKKSKKAETKKNSKSKK